MSTPGVPPWGCPWHGLLRGGQLELPNGEVMDFPQFGYSAWYQAGQTRLLRHPNAPQDTRSEAQLADDESMGRQWWREAIIAGDTLHGRPLGFGHRWIYIDADGMAWVVEPDISLFSTATTITLFRFGVLGGTPQQYVYTLDRPDLEQSEPAISLLSLSLLLADSKSDGSAGLFVIAGGFTANDRDVFPWAPLGWVQVELSGAAHELAINITVVKSRAQALGEITIEDNFNPGHWYEHGPIPDPIYGLDPHPDRSIDLYRSVAFEGAYDRVERTVRGKTLAMLYSPSGELRELTFDFSSVQTSTESVRTVDFAENAYSGERVTTSNLVTTVRLSLDAEALFDERYETTLNVSQSISGDYRSTGDWTVVNETLREFPNGSQDTAGSGTTTWDFAFQPTLGWRTVPVDFESARLDSAARYGPEPLFVGQGPALSLMIQPAMHSFNLYSLTTRLNTDESDEYLGSAATNFGVVSLPSLVTTERPIYGSACPVTLQVARDTVPICYT